MIIFFFATQSKLQFIAVKRHEISMVNIKTVISSKQCLSLIDSLQSMVITTKTTDLKHHRLYITDNNEPSN